MQTENAWSSEDWNGVNKLKVSFVRLFVRDNIIVIQSRKEELLVGVKDEISKEFFQVAFESTSIPVVCNSTTVHGISD